MEECPRCGFIQPKDKFCANCGLNIEKYNPAPEPLYKQIIKSTWLPITLIIFFVGSLIFTIFYFKKNFTKSSEEEIVATQAYSSNEPGYEADEPEQEDEEEMPVAAAPAQSAPKVESPTPKKEEPAKVYNRLNISFGLVSMERLEQIVNSGVLMDQQGDAQVYILKDKTLAENLSAIRNQKANLKKQSTPIVYENIVEVPGAQDPIGFMMSFQPGSKSNDTWNIASRIELQLRAKDTGEVKAFPYEFSHQINPESLIVITGILPRMEIPDMDLDYFNGFISYYQDPKFTDGSNESVIILELKAD